MAACVDPSEGLRFLTPASPRGLPDLELSIPAIRNINYSTLFQAHSIADVLQNCRLSTISDNVLNQVCTCNDGDLHCLSLIEISFCTK